MQRAAAFIFITCCALSALTLAEKTKDSKPPATVVPAESFSQTPNSTAEPTTTTTPNPTTTTTPNPTTTTTPNPTTTTTPKPTTPNPTNTTTPKPTTPNPTNTTTPKPTTPKPTNTTTPKPTTPKPTTPKPTTPKPTNTTTPKPTTPKPTTPKPTTTTTPKPTPTTTTPPRPGPTPSTNVTVGNYTLMADKTVVCLMAQMALKIRLQTPKANGTFIVQPKDTQTEGRCKETTANLTLVFKEGFITFLYNKSVADNSVYVDAVSFDLSYPLSTRGSNKPYNAKNDSLHLFRAKVGHSYSCTGESIYMGNGLYLDVSQDRMQAFNLTKSNNFGFPDNCPADQPDYRVAIAVGVTLLVLVVVVVLAYLLGRRRRTNGYQTL
ncbi:macrosialin-like isoform X1 [Brachyistius frenatus]|uniref:macrosialin-like isoform X1 n=1 Tax=Brachyistius frenatus TaxID=100188 RepID=UPI0037E8E8EC